MKKYLILFIVSLFMACAEEPIEVIPIDVFSIEKMTAVMVDIQLIEGGIVIRKYNKTQRQGEIVEYYKALFEKHQISREEFDYSFKYYTDHPEKLEEVYEKMLEKLSELEAEVGNEKVDTSATGK